MCSTKIYSLLHRVATSLELAHYCYKQRAWAQHSIRPAFGHKLYTFFCSELLQYSATFV